MVHVLDGDRVIDPRGGVWGVVSAGNPLKGGFTPPRGARMIVWTGWTGDEPAERAGRGFEVWGPGAWEGLREAVRGALPAYERAGTRLVLRAHARHVVSDAQRWVKLREEFPLLGLLLDPVSLLSAEMLARAEVHLARWGEALGAGGPAGGVEGVLVSDGSAGEDGLLRPVAWGEGEMPRGALMELARRCGGAAVVRGGDAGAASALGGIEA